MASELKTLKDFEIESDSNGLSYAKPSDLRDEAIKYIKEIIRIARINNPNFSMIDLPKVKFREDNIEFNNDKWDIDSPEFKFFILNGSSYIVMIGMIAHFFNITEEDLK